MARTIEEIQRALDESDKSIAKIEKYEKMLEQEEALISAQEKVIINKAFAPTQIENRNLLMKIQESLGVMERNIGQVTADLNITYDDLSTVDVDSINQSIEKLNKLLQLSDPENRKELLTALEESYKERKETLEKAYQEQKKEYDSLISDKKTQIEALEHKYKSLNIKRIVRATVITAIIFFILTFSIRWGTIAVNKISHSERKQGQVQESSTDIKKLITERNRGLIGLYKENEHSISKDDDMEMEI